MTPRVSNHRIWDNLLQTTVTHTTFPLGCLRGSSNFKYLNLSSWFLHGFPPQKKKKALPRYLIAVKWCHQFAQKNVRSHSFFSSSWIVHIQSVSKAYYLYLQNKPPAHLFITTSSNTTQVQGTTHSSLDSWNTLLLIYSSLSTAPLHTAANMIF